MRSFWFHFNKPASRAAGKPQWTVHYKDQCLIVDDIECHVLVKSRTRKRQPFAVICGKTDGILIKNKKATIL